jgi:hypothetical protein
VATMREEEVATTGILVHILHELSVDPDVVQIALSPCRVRTRRVSCARWPGPIWTVPRSLAWRTRSLPRAAATPSSWSRPSGLLPTAW